MTDPASVMHALMEIEGQLGVKQPFYEQAADDLARAKRDFDLRLARALVVAEGTSEKVRQANALIAVAAADDKVYERLADAEARHSAVKAVVSSLSDRAMIGMAVLKSLNQEARRDLPALQWSQVA